MVLDFVASSDLFDHRREHIFGDLDEIVVVCVGHVELAGRVLWVVSLINGLVSEVLADFKDSL